MSRGPLGQQRIKTVQRCQQKQFFVISWRQDLHEAKACRVTHRPSSTDWPAVSLTLMWKHLLTHLQAAPLSAQQSPTTPPPPHNSQLVLDSSLQALYRILSAQTQTVVANLWN